MNVNNIDMQEERRDNIKNNNSRVNRHQASNYQVTRDQSTFHSSVPDFANKNGTFNWSQKNGTENKSNPSEVSRNIILSLLNKEINENLNRLKENKKIENLNIASKDIASTHLRKLLEKCLAKAFAKTYMGEFMKGYDMNCIFRECIGRYFKDKSGKEEKVKREVKEQSENREINLEKQNNSRLSADNSEDVANSSSYLTKNETRNSKGYKPVQKANFCSHKDELHYAKVSLYLISSEYVQELLF